MDELQVKKNDELSITRSGSYRTFYVNHATGGHSSWDLHFTFSTLVEHSPGKGAVEEQVMVTMTLEFAKALIGTMQTAIAAFENKPANISQSQQPVDTASQSK